MAEVGSEKIRVLVLIKGLGIGGAEKLISEGARFWDRDSFEYTVAYVLPWKDQLVGALEDQGVEVHMIGGERGLTPPTVGRLRSLVKDLDVDLIHAHLPTMGIVARIASPVPVVYTEHNMADSYRPITRFLNRRHIWSECGGDRGLRGRRQLSEHMARRAAARHPQRRGRSRSA